MGIAFCLCYLHCALAGGQTFPLYVRLQVLAIAFFTLVRVFLWKERLAAIELAVPAAVVGLTFGRIRGTTALRLRAIVAKIGPYAAVPALFVAFTFTEYFRSWKTYSRTQSLPLVDFMVQRVASYYFTALNNGAGLLTTRSSEWPSFRFIFIADWIYHLPAGVGDGLYALVNGRQEHPTPSFLNSYATPEFNNMSGIFTIVYDVGIVGGLFYFLGFGIVAGMLYRSMIQGGKRGGMIYPIVFVAIVEVMRLPYLTLTRVVTLFVGTFLLLAQMRPRQVFRVVSAEGLQGEGATL
jgi:oligosaccharide repeat unit polymerase